MIDALGDPQSVLLLGGSSEIGLAIVDRIMARRGRRVVLAGRPSERLTTAVEHLKGIGVSEVVEVPFDAGDPRSHAESLDLAFSGGDLDVVVLAFGQLGDPDAMRQDTARAAELVNVNLAGAASALVEVGERLKRQGHGRIVVLSSVAGQRVRPANAVYGATKAGLDGLALALGDELAQSGIGVLVVRPGFVHTRMTEGMDPQPFSTTPDEVANRVEEALRRNKTVVWAPGILRYVFAVLKLLPTPLWRVVAGRS